MNEFQIDLENSFHGFDQKFWPIKEKLINFNKCPICKSDDIDDVVSLEGQKTSFSLKVGLCKSCCTLFYRSIPSEGFFKEYYENKWKKKRNTPKANFKIATILELLFPQKKNMSILDVGTGNGSMITGLEQKGFTNIEGCEPNKNSYLEAKKKGLIIKLGDYKKINFKKKFDIIYSNHVMEHVIDPLNFLDWKIKQLKKNGLIIINVPNAVFEPTMEQIFFFSHLFSFSTHTFFYLSQKYKMNIFFWKSNYHDEISVILSKKKFSNFKVNDFYFFKKTVNLPKLLKKKINNDLKFKLNILPLNRTVEKTEQNFNFFNALLFYMLIFIVKNNSFGTRVRFFLIKVFNYLSSKYRIYDFGFLKIDEIKKKNYLSFVFKDYINLIG